LSASSVSRVDRPCAQRVPGEPLAHYSAPNGQRRVWRGTLGGARSPRAHQLAVSEGVSLQEIIVRGLTEVFTSKGLPGIGA
jgi:hypothetical protein